jgi:mRNA-degrading endonuclease toxin of MazEF toxin-antitoxin module
LPDDSAALPDQIRTVDKTRIAKLIGKVTASELAAIDAALRIFLKLPVTATPAPPPPAATP